MGNKFKILYIFAALPVGGAEQVLVTELEGLDRKLFVPDGLCHLGERILWERRSNRWVFRLFPCIV